MRPSLREQRKSEICWPDDYALPNETRVRSTKTLFSLGAPNRVYMATSLSASEQAEEIITAHATSPEKTVFVQSGNHDAWIATDLVVDLER
jgi:hypothetical protein